MEPTSVKTHDSAALKNDAPSHSVHQHAPTLLAGEGCAADEVRVWAPCIWSVRSILLFGIAALVNTLGLLAFPLVFRTFPPEIASALAGERLPPGLLLPAIALLVFDVAMIAVGWKALHRPKLVTTDGHGIALTTARGSRAFSWENITAARLFGSSLKLETDHDRVVVHLLGYCASAQKELFATIAQRASLFYAGRVRCVRNTNPGCSGSRQPAFPRLSASQAHRRAIARFVFSALAGVILVAEPIVGNLTLYHLGQAARAESWWPSDGRKGADWSTLNRMARAVGNWKPVKLSHPDPFPGPRLNALLFVAQRPGDPIATVTVPGFSIGTEFEQWAAVAYQRASAPVYVYDLYLWRLGPTPAGKTVKVRLDYGSHHRWVTVRAPSSHLLDEKDPHVPLYSNNWGDAPAREIQTGAIVGTLPSPRVWSYGAIAVDRVRGKPKAVGITFEPAPIQQRVSCHSQYTPTAAAAWLPGTIKARGAWCVIRFSDGSVRRVRVDSGPGRLPHRQSLCGPAGPATIRTRWGLAPDELRKLPAGRI